MLSDMSNGLLARPMLTVCFPPDSVDFSLSSSAPLRTLRSHRHVIRCNDGMACNHNASGALAESRVRFSVYKNISGWNVARVVHRLRLARFCSAQMELFAASNLLGCRDGSYARRHALAARQLCGRAKESG